MSWIWPLVPAVLIGLGLVYVIGNWIYGLVLLSAAERAWAASGVRCLLIHSDSPVWSGHVQAQWLPSFGQFARQLNWSHRATWPPSLEVRLFRQFCLGQFNYNPAVLVFRGLRSPLVFRFFYAFHEAKHGNAQYLERLEAQMFAALGVPRGGPTRS
jgi:hypothetical protein